MNSWTGFDPNDHELFAHSNGKHHKPKEKVKLWRQNRREIQGYLSLIQSRINRGHTKGALALFNRLISEINAPYWMVLALKDELDCSALRK